MAPDTEPQLPDEVDFSKLMGEMIVLSRLDLLINEDEQEIPLTDFISIANQINIIIKTVSAPHENLTVFIGRLSACAAAIRSMDNTASSMIGDAPLNIKLMKILSDYIIVADCIAKCRSRLQDGFTYEASLEFSEAVRHYVRVFDHIEFYIKRLPEYFTQQVFRQVLVGLDNLKNLQLDNETLLKRSQYSIQHQPDNEEGPIIRILGKSGQLRIDLNAASSRRLPLDAEA